MKDALGRKERLPQRNLHSYCPSSTTTAKGKSSFKLHGSVFGYQSDITQGKTCKRSFHKSGKENWIKRELQLGKMSGDMYVCGEMVAKQRRDIESVGTWSDEQHCCQIYSTFSYCFKIFIKHRPRETYSTLVSLSQSSRLSGGNADEIMHKDFLLEELTIRQYRKNRQSVIILQSNLMSI